MPDADPVSLDFDDMFSPGRERALA